MARGLWLSQPGRLWALTGALLGVGALLAWSAPTALWDWQPQRANSQPWRLFSAAFVHWSPLHLGANLIGTALVAALGWTARVPPALALAWLVAWPLTHLALLAQPTLMHYGGLSGLLHAGVAAVATWLLLRASGRPRWVGAALLAGLALKVGLEAPWAGPLMQAPGWDIAIAPLAHASGSAAGLLGALAVALASRRH